MSINEGRKAYFRAYYHNNKDKIKAIQKQYYHNNKDKCKQRLKDKYHNDPIYRQRKLAQMADYRKRKASERRARGNLERLLEMKNRV